MLTFAIPYYAGEAYIHRAIESVLVQSDPRWRLIVCDGGRDASPMICTRYSDSRIRYVLPDGITGMAANWNRALASGETDLVTLLHQDDELLPTYVQQILNAAEQYTDAAVIFCEARIIDANSNPVFSFADYVKRFYRPRRGHVVRLHGERGLQAVMRANFIMCPTMCFRRSRLGSIRFQPHWNQVLDLDLIAQLLLNGESLIGLPHEQYAYRRHRDNTTAVQTQTLVRFHEERDLFRQIALLARQHGWCRAAATAEHLGIVKLNLGYCFIRDLLAFRWRDASRKVRLLIELMD